MSELKEKLEAELKPKEDKVVMGYDEISGKEFKMPNRFFTTNNGIYMETGNVPMKVCSITIWPTATIINLDSGIEKVRLHFKRRNNVKEGAFLKSQIIASPTDLANFGIPIDRDNADYLAKYLMELEILNEDEIPLIKAVSKLGWRDDKQLFLPFSKDTDIIIDIASNQEKWINAYKEKRNFRRMG